MRTSVPARLLTPPISLRSLAIGLCTAFAIGCGAGNYSIDPCHPDPNDPYQGKTLADCKAQCSANLGGYCIANALLEVSETTLAWTCIPRVKSANDTLESLTPVGKSGYLNCLTSIPVNPAK